MGGCRRPGVADRGGGDGDGAVYGVEPHAGGQAVSGLGNAREGAGRAARDATGDRSQRAPGGKGAGRADDRQLIVEAGAGPGDRPVDLDAQDRSGGVGDDVLDGRDARRVAGAEGAGVGQRAGDPPAARQQAAALDGDGRAGEARVDRQLGVRLHRGGGDRLGAGGQRDARRRAGACPDLELGEVRHIGADGGGALQRQAVAAARPGDGEADIHVGDVDAVALPVERVARVELEQDGGAGLAERQGAGAERGRVQPLHGAELAGHPAARSAHPRRWRRRCRWHRRWCWRQSCG